MSSEEDKHIEVDKSDTTTANNVTLPSINSLAEQDLNISRPQSNVNMGISSLLLNNDAQTSNVKPDVDTRGNAPTGYASGRGEEDREASGSEKKEHWQDDPTQELKSNDNDTATSSNESRTEDSIVSKDLKSADDQREAVGEEHLHLQSAQSADHHHHRHHHHHHHHHHLSPSNPGPIPHIHHGGRIIPIDELKTNNINSDHTQHVDHRRDEPSEGSKEGDLNIVEQATPQDKANAVAINNGTKENGGGHSAVITNSNEETPYIHTSNGPKLLLNKSQIEDILTEMFPVRRNLGSLIYNPTTTWETLQVSQLTGLKPEHLEKFEEIKRDYKEKLEIDYYSTRTKYIPCIPPLPNDYINYLLEVKIPYKHVKLFKEQLEIGLVPESRAVWGGVSGVYTDDSDVLLALAHSGLFDNTLDLSSWNHGWKPTDVVVPLNAIKDDLGIYGDLSVTLLLLPGLSNYTGFYANRFNSRSWKGPKRHAGLSFAIYDVKWESIGAYLRDRSLFKLSRRELVEDFGDSRESTGKPWQFKRSYYDEIKRKYANVDSVHPSKKEILESP